jgi:hypothetical protein
MDEQTVIPMGQRNTELHNAAKAMRDDGRSYTDILEAMLTMNEVKCDPPLAYMEVTKIVGEVVKADVKS